MPFRFFALSLALFSIAAAQSSSSLCYYNDACNGKLISAPRGGTLLDSCPNTFHVSSTCALTFVQRGPLVGLSPPWFTIQRTFAYTIGQSSKIMMTGLSGSGPKYSMVVVAFEGRTAQALANVFKNKFSFGGVTVDVAYRDIRGTKYDPIRSPSVADLTNALVNNPLVDAVALKQITCTATVIQFWNDDISNPYRFTSMLAADGFNGILRDGVRAVTIGKKLINQ